MLQFNTLFKKNLFFFVVLFCFSSIQAQTAADYKVTATATPSTCQQNGTITAKVTKADGSALDMSQIEKIYYDFRIAGTNQSVTGGFTDTNLASQLLPGNYDIHVNIIHKNSTTTSLSTSNINVANEYVELKQVRKHVSKNGLTLNCVPTGEVELTVAGKQYSTYSITFLEKPAEYPNQKIENITISTSAGTLYKLKNLPAGKYKYHITNECGGLPVDSFTITAVTSDFPYQNLDKPSKLNITNFCSGLNSILIYDSSSSSYNTFFSTFVGNSSPFYGGDWLFFDYAIASRGEVEKIENGEMTTSGLTWYSKPPFNSKNIYYYMSADKPTYAQLTNPADPLYKLAPVRLYFRIKSTLNPDSSCADQGKYIPLELPPKPIYKKTTLSFNSGYPKWECATYRTSVYAKADENYSACSLNFTTYEVDATTNQRVGDPQQPHNIASYFGSYSPTGLDAQKKYRVMVLTTDIDGGTHLDSIDLAPPAKGFFEARELKATVSLKYCSSELARMSLQLPSSSHDGVQITLLSAPAGYDPSYVPATGYRMIHVNETLTLKDGSYTNPFSYSDATQKTNDQHAKLPAGDYTFSATHPCAGKTITFTVPVSYPTNADLVQNIDPEFGGGCGSSMLYPFKKGIKQYVTQNGKPINFRVQFFQNGIQLGGYLDIKVSDITNQTASIKDKGYPVTTTAGPITAIFSHSPIYYYEYKGSPSTSNPLHYDMKGGPQSSYVQPCEVGTQTITLPELGLTYNRSTYYGYKCSDGMNAYLGIEAINGVGPYTYVLMDMDENILQEIKTVPKGTLAKFTIPKPDGGDLTQYYRMHIKDDGCPGYEKYETLEVYELSAQQIRNYARKVCIGTDQNISPINGIDGIVGESMSYDWEIIQNPGTINGLEAKSNQTQVMSGVLTLQEGVTTPQVAKLRVTPSYGNCGGQPFEITLVVSPCINYWYGTTGTAWDTPDNWTENKVPTTGEDVIFATNENNPFFEGIAKSGPAKDDLMVPKGSPKTVGNFINETPLKTIIPSEASLIVTKEVKGSGLPEQAHKLVVGAEANKPNGTFIVTTGCAQPPIYGTVQLYAKGYKGAKETWEDTIEGSPTKGQKFSSEYHWQYFGVPVESILANPTFHGSKLRIYDETLNSNTSFYNKWHWLNNSSELEAFKGYSITQESPKIYSIAGKLQFCEKEVTMTRRAPAVAGAGSPLSQQNIHYGLGQNLFGNSFTAAIDITKLTFPPEVENTVYLYNTGRFHDWATTGELVTDNTQRSAGNWFAIPQNSAPAVWDNQIPSLQGFMLKFNDDDAVFGEPDVTIALKYADGGVTGNKRPQLVKSQHAQEPLSYMRVNLESASTRDALWLISHDEGTNGFDNGWDGRKYFGTPTAYIFTENKDGLMQVNADKTIDGSIVSFYANSDRDYELTLIKSNLDQYADLHLLDLVNHTATALDSDTTHYRFSSINQGHVEKRFIIVNSGEINFDYANLSMLSAYWKDNNMLVVSNLTGKEGRVSLYDTAGRSILSSEMPKGISEIPVTLSQGIYIVDLQVEGIREPVKIVVK